MPRKTVTGRNPNGTGSIRKITTTRNGKEYTYWQARFTVGYDPGTGKQIQRSITGKTQKEVLAKLKQATYEVDKNIYQPPNKQTVSEWLDVWMTEYLKGVKPRTADSYKATIKNHIKPGLGAVRLDKLSVHDIQLFYNKLAAGDKQKMPLSAKSVRNTHGVLHKALEQAVRVGYLSSNPAGLCELPKAVRPEIKPLDEDLIRQFLDVIKGHKYETLYITTLFTGLREGEVLGLTWDCVDFKDGTVTINKQLQKDRNGSGEYNFVSTKNGKSRRLTPAPYVMETLLKQYQRQQKWRNASGDQWENRNLVFTNETGHNLSAQTVYLHFKKLAAKAGCPEARFHDLRHSYAVAALQCGDDIKTVQENLGHHTASFTLDVYGHVTEKMKRASASRMQSYIANVAV